MIDWLGWWPKLRRVEEPLRGAPVVRRLKTYSAQSGYVYQYFYEGYRVAAETTTYVFQTSVDRKSSFPVSVLLPASSLGGRELTGTECYAVAKMALFQAFDERLKPLTMREPVLVRPADATAILETLGRA
ncbi:MAG: hypothetical protein NTY38_08145 [Acidobacteria bacterium]|nr:hypothetical protein [Acidobacteriota bacterium]